MVGAPGSSLGRVADPDDGAGPQRGTVSGDALLHGTLRAHRWRTALAAALLGGHQVTEALVPVFVGYDKAWEVASYFDDSRTGL